MDQNQDFEGQLLHQVFLKVRIVWHTPKDQSKYYIVPGSKDKSIVGRNGAKDKKEGKEQKNRAQLLNSTSKKGTEAKSDLSEHRYAARYC